MIVAYARVSVEDTTDTNSLSLQESRMRAQAQIHGRSITHAFTDNGVSGARKDRPALDALLALVRGRKVKVVYITALDRLSRKLAHLVELIDLFERHGVALVSLREGVDTGTSIGRLITNVLGSVAEFERESIRTRMREASGERLRRGIKHCVRLPFGYRLGAGNRLVPNDAEQRVIDEMRHLRGGTNPTSFARIADTLNARAARPRSGRKWYASTVRDVLTSAIAARAVA